MESNGIPWVLCRRISYIILALCHLSCPFQRSTLLSSLHHSCSSTYSATAPHALIVLKGIIYFDFYVMLVYQFCSLHCIVLRLFSALKCGSLHSHWFCSIFVSVANYWNVVRFQCKYEQVVMWQSVCYCHLALARFVVYLFCSLQGFSLFPFTCDMFYASDEFIVSCRMTINHHHHSSHIHFLCQKQLLTYLQQISIGRVPLFGFGCSQTMAHQHTLSRRIAAQHALLLTCFCGSCDSFF